MIDQNCLFCKIVSGQIPATIIEKTDRITAFNDITPQAPVHILIIPNQHLATMAQVAEHDLELAGEIIELADKLAKQMGLESYRTNINTGADAGQSVFHAHLHLLGGRAFAWPPG